MRTCTYIRPEHQSAPPGTYYCKHIPKSKARNSASLSLLFVRPKRGNRCSNAIAFDAHFSQACSRTQGQKYHSNSGCISSRRIDICDLHTNKKTNKISCPRHVRTQITPQDEKDICEDTYVIGDHPVGTDVKGNRKRSAQDVIKCHNVRSNIYQCQRCSHHWHRIGSLK